MKTKEEPEEAIKDTITGNREIIFGSDTPACTASLDEIRKQQVIDQNVYDKRLIEDPVRRLAWEGLQKNIVMDGDMMIDKRTGGVLDLAVAFKYWKEKVLADYIALIDYKITCCRVEELHILNGTDTLDT